MTFLSVGAWDAAVDYVRLTHRRGNDDEQVWKEYGAAVQTIGHYAGGPGTREEAWEWMGYRGTRLGNCSHGVGVHGHILQCSGVSAREVLRLGLPYHNVPRLDIQITYWLQSDIPALAASLAAVANVARHRQGRRPYSVRMINGYGDGDTLYLGRRGKNTSFLRLYDKWRESKDDRYRYAWRAECELTDEVARLCWGSLLDLGDAPEVVASLVRGYWEMKGVGIPLVEGVRSIAPEWVPRDETSDDRRLRWLKEQVRPAIEKLLARGVDASEIRAILSLSDQSSDEAA